ncbi:MAG: hypothetical protein JWM42_308 [Burkholderia sp.]|nr:hypothetical protein [Burkholderia sp.]
MKNVPTILIAGLLSVSAAAWGQSRVEKAPDAITKMPEPDMRSHPDSSAKSPDPGLSNLPDASGSSGTSGDSVTNTGIVKVPPSTGTENVVTPPKDIDPGITEPTDDIDRKNRQRSEKRELK